MKTHVQTILIGIMASILSINAFACDSSLEEKTGSEETRTVIEEKPTTPVPALNTLVDSVPTPVEQLNLEIQQSSSDICPCDVKSAITSSKSTLLDDVPSPERSPTVFPELTPTSQSDPLPTPSPIPKPKATPSLVVEEKVALVQIKKYRFQDITIKSGEVVEWKNLDLDMHSTTSGIWGNDDVGNLWDSGKMTFGKGFKFRFMKAGEYPYFCRIHPAMKGVVRVLDSSK